MKDPSSMDRKRSGSASHWFGVKISENWRDNATTKFQNASKQYLMLPISFCAKLDRDKDRAENASEGHDSSDQAISLVAEISEAGNSNFYINLFNHSKLGTLLGP